MDNVTHALAGLLLADLTTRQLARRDGRPVDRSVRRTAAVLGIAAAEFPDLDLLYSGPVLGMGKLGYLLHHRGHTHTIVVALVSALVLWGLALVLSRQVRAGPTRLAMLGLAVAGTLSHIALDFTNSYGVHPFWPVDNRWVYGDMVFIVEPWLWVIAIPALVMVDRSRFGRVALIGALLLILAAAWTLGMVPSGVALALTLTAALWSAGAYALRTGRVTALAVAAWCAFELVSGIATRAAFAQVARVVPDGLADVVLTPAAADPLCFDAIVVEATDTLYRVHRATVAAWPAVRARAACRAASARSLLEGSDLGILREGVVPTPHAESDAVTWRLSWAAPRAELVRLAERCDVRAALGFIRVPVWRVEPDGEVRLSDLRYGTGGDGFADVRFPREVDACPRFVPPWRPPRWAELVPARQGA